MAASAQRSSPPPPASNVPAIAGRFVPERTLGRGGMGEVLAVLEPSSGKRFALKRLLPAAKQRHVTLLEREYHTLANLRHPHIVQAFDFGSAEGLPFYTMELLAGADLEALAPLPWTEVVHILRAVASALAVLHARGLVHRDVSARNVWRTPEGAVKLIDFGALTSFGAASDLAGTPPYVAPEALRSHRLDQRTDLYALGALGYYLLAGRHAFPARSLAELEPTWAIGHTPLGRRLSELTQADTPSVPEGLELVIEALLSAAPEARPAQAAEVLDALDAVLPESAGARRVAREGSLSSALFVGRSAERRQLCDLLGRDSGCAVVLGPRGIGRSRLLAELATEARVAGLAVMQVTGDGDARPLSAAAHVVQTLFEIMPAEAGRAAAPEAALLGHLSPEVCARVGLSTEQLERFPEVAGEARMRVQGALQRFFVALAHEARVVFFLDDLQGMDEASVGAFAALRRDQSAGGLVLIAALRDDEPPTVATRAFLSGAHTFPLRPLSSGDGERMLSSIFGNVEHVARLTQVLMRATSGNPGQLVEACAYLVERGSIRWLSGAWSLPQEVSSLSVPDSFAAFDLARIARLGPSAAALLRALSVLDRVLPLELCVALAKRSGGDAFAAVDELCRAGVLDKADAGYAFRSEGARRAVLAQLPADEAARHHLAAGEALLELEQLSAVERAAAGVHLLHGGATSRGLEVLHGVALSFTSRVSEDSYETAKYVEQAYPLLAQRTMHDAERLSFLSVLAMGGFFLDRRFGFRYGEEALRCGERVCRMGLARRLAPWLGKTLSLYVALVVAGVSLGMLKRRSRLVPSLPEAIRMFMTAAGSLAGMYTLCIDSGAVRASARSVEPFCALGRDHVAWVVYHFALACAATVSDRMDEARRRWTELMARLDDPRPIAELEGPSRDYYVAASLYAWGGSEAWRDQSRALELAARLDRQPLKLYQASADQVRAQYYGQQGKMELVAECRARIERMALQSGIAWQVELWWPCSAVASATRQRDALTLKRCAEQLPALAQDTPSLGDFTDYAVASGALLRRRYGEALPILENILAHRTRDRIGYANIAGLLASAHNGLKQHDQAERVCTRVIDQFEPGDFDSPGLTLRVRIERCLARAALGQEVAAAAELDALITRFEPEQGPLTLGALHDARAQVAVRAADFELATRHVERMRHWYRATDCPSLQQYAEAFSRRLIDTGGATDPSAGELVPSQLAQFSSCLTSVFASCADLLAELVHSAAAAEGAFVLAAPPLPLEVVQTRAAELPGELLRWAEARLEEARAAVTETQDGDVGAAGETDALECDGEHWRITLLFSERSGEVFGALLLRGARQPLPLAVQRAIAQRLEQVRPSQRPARRAGGSAPS